MAKKNEIPMYYNKHYIRTNDQSHIVDGFSDAFREPTENDICINEQGGYQFRLFPSGEENPPLFDGLYIPIYKYINNEIVEVTAEEKAAIVAEREEAARAAEQERIANDPTTLAMEMAVDHELRLSMLEMGIE